MDNSPAHDPFAKNPAAPAAPALRASDADRDRVAEALHEAYAEGRLDSEEHSERLEATYAAKTLAELAPLTADLPVQVPAQAAAPAAPAGAGTGELEELKAVFGGSERKGRFRVGRGFRAVAVFGGVEIDLREAEFDQPVTVIECLAVFGGVEVKVPPHVTLRGGGTGIFGGFEVQHGLGADASTANASGAAGPAGGVANPVVEIRGKAVFGGVEAKHRRDRLAQATELAKAVRRALDR